MSSPVVLGLDPGFASFGIAAVQLHPHDEQVLSTAVFRTEKTKRRLTVRASEDNARRAREIAAALESAVQHHRPVALCAETMSWPRDAGAGAKVALAWGALCAVAEAHGLPLVQASPQDVKRAVCGYKTASKDEVALAIETRYPEVQWPPQKTLLEHAADAVAVVVACLPTDVLRMARKAAA